MKADILKKKLGVVALVVMITTTMIPAASYAASSSSTSTTSSVSAVTGATPTAPTSGTTSGGTPPAIPSGGSGGGGANTMTYDYSGTYKAVVKASNTTVKKVSKVISTTVKDKNAAAALKGGKLVIKNSTLKKSGSDTNGDNCNFYGVNSILLAANSGSKAYVAGSTLKATSTGSNGIFATDSAKVYANNDKITTTGDNSRGLDATYGGTIIANKMTINTSGDHCAALATDRGGGNISVTNSKLTTAGSGSPLLYSTGNIQVDNVTGTASGSQIAGMEGLNTILIYNSKLTSTSTTKTASDPIADGIILYQSTSGDAESTTGEAADFEASNSTLTSKITSGAMFYVTNTNANVVLSNTTLNFDSDNVNLLTVAGNDSNNWGTAGKNGGTLSFTGIGETLNGNIDVDTISSLDLYLLKGTTYTGATKITTNSVNTSKTDAPITVNLDKTSKWVVTGNSTVTNLNAAEGSQIVDKDGKTVSIVVNGKTVVSGTSDLKVTVTGTYSTTVKTDSSNALSTSNVISRTAFDKYYGTTTTFGKN